MSNMRLLCAAVVCCIVLFFAGCGGGGSSAVDDNGWEYLMRMSEGEGEVDQMIASADAAFAAGQAQNPSDPDPQLGGAVVDLIELLMQIEQQITPPTAPSELSLRLVAVGDIFTIDELFENDGQKVRDIAVNLAVRIAALTQTPASRDINGVDPEAVRVALHNSYLPSLYGIADVISQIGYANSGVIAIAQYEEAGVRVDIDQGDVLMFAGVVRALTAAINAATCYSWDVGEWTGEDDLDDLDLDGDGILLPGDFLPPLPCLNLVDSPTFSGLSTQFDQAFTELADGIQSTLDETGDQTYDIFEVYDELGFVSVARQDLEDAKATIEDMQDALTTPTSITHDGVTTTLNVSAWFASPPAVRSLIGQLNYDPDDGDFDDWEMWYSNLPDNTFGGLFPDGLPQVWWEDGL